MGAKLTAAQIRRRAFAELVAGGMNATEAARQAGFRGTQHALEVTGSRLLRHAEVQALVQAAAEKASSKRVLTAQQRRELLTEFAESKGPVDIRDRIAAIKELNAMDGLHIKRLEHTGGGGEPLAGVLAGVDQATLRARLAELRNRKTKGTKA